MKRINEQVGFDPVTATISITFAAIKLLSMMGMFGQQNKHSVRDVIYATTKQELTGKGMSKADAKKVITKDDVWAALRAVKNKKVAPGGGWEYKSEYKKQNGFLDATPIPRIDTYYVFFNPSILGARMLKNAVEKIAKPKCKAKGGTYSEATNECILPTLPPEDKEHRIIEAGMMKNILWFMVIGGLVGGGYLLYKKYKGEEV